MSPEAIFSAMPLALVTSFAAAVLLTPSVGRLAERIGAIDAPGGRRLHVRPTPRLGGATLLLGLAAGLLALAQGALPAGAAVSVERWVGVLVGASLVFLVGAYDDLRSASAWAKLVVEVTAAVVAVVCGFRVEAVVVPLSGELWSLGALGPVATVAWLVAVMNAFNLIDGLDGLCVGLTSIAAAALAVVAGIHGQAEAMALLALVAATVLGFLYHNRNPASIFPGDSGSLALGFLLGVGALWAAESPTDGAARFGPALLALGLPLADMTAAILRRLFQVLTVARRELPERERFEFQVADRPRLFQPDRRHVHHRLIDVGFSHRGAVRVLWSVGAVLGAGAVATAARPALIAPVIAVATGLGVYLLVFRLRYHELAVLRKGLLLPLFEWRALARRRVHAAIDAILAGAAFALAYIGIGTVGGEIVGGPGAVPLLGVTLVVELAVLYLSGLYRGAYRHGGIGEALRVLRSAVLAAAAPIAGTALVYGLTRDLLAVHVLNGLFLVLALLASRVSFRVLDYVYQHGRDGAPTLLYGTGRGGDLALREILANPRLGWRPVGFIDDQVHQRGRYFGGYPIMGTVYDLAHLLRAHAIRRVVLTTEKLTAERRAALLEICRIEQVPVERFRIEWERLPLSRTAKDHVVEGAHVADGVGPGRTVERERPDSLLEPEGESDRMTA